MTAPDPLLMNAPGPAPTLTLMVNGQAHTLSPPLNVASLLVALGQAPESVAIAVNGEFVARHRRADWPLRQGDQVTCFKPIVGG